MGPVAAAILNFFSWRAEFGARNIYHAATQPSKSGAFISHCKEQPPWTFVVSAQGQQAQEKFWKECMELWEGLSPGLSKEIA